jgi:predicted transcriptional regulator
LAKKGWSILDWANYAGVAYHTAEHYHDGTKKTTASTRLKLANALGIEVEDLPE